MNQDLAYIEVRTLTLLLDFSQDDVPTGNGEVSNVDY